MWESLFKILQLLIYRVTFFTNKSMTDKHQPAPGDGIRSLKTSRIFKAANFELYVKPNAVIMGIGIVAIAGCTAYIAYMRSKYEALGYYAAVKEDGTEQFTKRKSKWD